MKSFYLLEIYSEILLNEIIREICFKIIWVGRSDRVDVTWIDNS